ncbi:MAG: VanW family protein [Candidatus Berkelbacteria bacterium]|nr:VanW family protein [Candidatus Berkelbacteria bacterium]
MEKDKKQSVKTKKMTKKAVFIILIVVSVLVLSFAGYSVAYANKVFPNIYVAGENFGGLSKNEIKTKLTSKIDNFKSDKVILSYENQKWEVSLVDLNFKYDIDATVSQIWQTGRETSFFQSVKEQFLAPFKKKEIVIQSQYDAEVFKDRLSQIAEKVNIETQVFGYILKDGQIEKLEPKSGRELRVEKNKALFEEVLGNLNNNLSVIVEEVKPHVTDDPAGGIKAKFVKIVDGDLILKHEKESFKIEPKDFQHWIKFAEKQDNNKNWQVDIELNEDATKEYLKTIAQKIDQDPQDAKLTISNGVATVFQAEQNGYKLDKDKALSQIKDALLGEGKRQIALTILTVKPKISASTINDLGIKELIAEATTSWKGSPKNRIHNISVGANLFNGALIKPGEEFSFVKTMGAVSAERGFLPELVIKEDKVTPEIGGGMCQVSTTMFRVALNAGLPITARTPHSFRVSYYEPPVGFDATVYEPNPDLKFINDTPGYILIQAKAGTNSLTFQFYGTKDGRTVKFDGPYTSDRTSPPPPRYFDDPSLPAGTLKQFERAVAGLTAKFNYTVYKNGAVLHQQTFVSKYVAWPSEYKRGTGGAPATTAPAPAPAPEPTPTPAPEPTPTPPAPTCSDGVQNGDEAGVDCGGSSCWVCPVPTP